MLIKAREPSLPCYLPIAGEGGDGFIEFPKRFCAKVNIKKIGIWLPDFFFRASKFCINIINLTLIFLQLDKILYGISMRNKQNV